MVKTKPELDPDGRYGLYEAAKSLGISYNTINNWTSKGLLKSYIRDVNGRRFWLGADLISIWQKSY